MPATSLSRNQIKILKIFNGHGAYVRACGEHYFLCAADLNRQLDPGKAWDEPEAQRRVLILLVAEIEAEFSASTSAGSHRFTVVDDYVRHRRGLNKSIRTCRAFLKAHASSLRLRERVAALISARG